MSREIKEKSLQKRLRDVYNTTLGYVYDVLIDIPIFFLLIWYCGKYRSSPAILSNVNPAFLHGGLFCAKSEILKVFQKKSQLYNEFFAKTVLIRKESTLQEKIIMIKGFIHDNQLDYPLVIKPDRGLAGIGVSLINDSNQMHDRMISLRDDYLVQEYIDRPKELSVFYIKDPEDDKGKLRAITERSVIRKGRGLPKMIIPGNKFRNEDESSMINPILEKTFNDISDMEGFYFGRYDIRVKDMDNFIKHGKDFKILEVNVGAQTMALQAYDHKYSMLQKYAIFAQQLDFTFKVAKENLKRYPDQKKLIQRPIRDFIATYIHILRKIGK